MRGPCQAVADFHDRHKTRYGHNLDDDLAEVVNIRLTAFGATPKPLLHSRLTSEGTPEPRARREVYSVTGDPSMVPIYHREDLRSGQRLETPSVVQQVDSTTYLPFGDAHVDATGSIVVDLP